MPDPEQCLYCFHWLSLRLGLDAGSLEPAAKSVRLLSRYVGACQPYDPEINRLYRALDWVEEALAAPDPPLPRAPAARHALEQSRAESRELLTRFKEQLDRQLTPLVRHAVPIVQTPAEQRRELRDAYHSPQRETCARVKAYLEERQQRAPSPVLAAYLVLMGEVERDANP